MHSEGTVVGSVCVTLKLASPMFLGLKKGQKFENAPFKSYSASELAILREMCKRLRRSKPTTCKGAILFSHRLVRKK